MACESDNRSLSARMVHGAVGMLSDIFFTVSGEREAESGCSAFEVM